MQIRLTAKFMICACASSLLCGDATYAVSQDLPQKTFLMVSPDELIEGGSITARLNIYKKWNGIKNSIEEAGGKVLVIDGKNPAGGPREVWVRDKYFILGSNAYLPDRKRAQLMGDTYAAEIDQAENYLRSRNIKTFRVIGAWFEGGNIIPHYKSRTVFLGFRSGEQDDSPALLANAINENEKNKFEVIPIELVNFRNKEISRKKNGDYLYHLDTGMSEELPRGEVLLSPDISDPETIHIIRNRIGDENIIFISREDSLNYAANLVSLGDTIIPNGISHDLQERLERRGYKVKPQPGFNYGGPHCNANILPVPTFYPD